VWFFIEEKQNDIGNVGFESPSGSIVILDMLLPNAKSGGLFLHRSWNEAIVFVKLRNLVRICCFNFVQRMKYRILNREEHPSIGKIGPGNAVR
jgi:hypothetical protein